MVVVAVLATLDILVASRVCNIRKTNPTRKIRHSTARSNRNNSRRRKEWSVPSRLHTETRCDTRVGTNTSAYWACVRGCVYRRLYPGGSNTSRRSCATRSCSTSSARGTPRATLSSSSIASAVGAVRRRPKSLLAVQSLYMCFSFHSWLHEWCHAWRCSGQENRHGHSADAHGICSRCSGAVCMDVPCIVAQWHSLVLWSVSFMFPTISPRVMAPFGFACFSVNHGPSAMREQGTAPPTSCVGMQEQTAYMGYLTGQVCTCHVRAFPPAISGSWRLPMSFEFQVGGPLKTVGVGAPNTYLRRAGLASVA